MSPKFCQNTLPLIETNVLIKMGKRIGHSSIIKVALCSIISLLLIVLAVYGYIHRRDASINSRLQGIWNIVDENHLRKQDYILTFNIIHFQSDAIELPSFESSFSETNNSENKGYSNSSFWYLKLGNWKLISTRPDSIMINHPIHPLKGKYAIQFSKELLEDHFYHYFLYLNNDSTQIILEKQFSNMFGTPPSKKEWER